MHTSLHFKETKSYPMEVVMKKVLFAVVVLTLFFTFTSSDLYAINWRLSQKSTQCHVLSSPPPKGGYTIQIKKVCGTVLGEQVMISLKITIRKGSKRKTLELSPININSQSFKSMSFDGKSFSAKAYFGRGSKVFNKRSGKMGFKTLMVDMKLE